MQPAARYAAAIGILDAWLDGEPVEKALTRWARGARYAGSKDRAAVRDHVYDVLRRKGTCAALGGDETGRALILGLLRDGGADLDDVFSGQGHAPRPLNEMESASRAENVPPNADTPEWMLREFDENRIPDLPDVLDALTRRAPVWLRVNTRRTSADQASEELRVDGIETQAHSTHPNALEVIEGARRIRQSTAYSEGLVELQDLSPQLAVAAIDLSQYGRILDFCAGGGGKALALADQGDAQVFVHDAIPRRMEDIGPRATRAGVQITQLDTAELASHGPFDLVLTDVPCSGSGTWRRDPEAKWRLTPDRLAELKAIQTEILDQGAALIAPGGQLVYMTCSLFRLENDAQIDAFLQRHDGWQCTARRLDTPLTASDGFFAATLRRT